MFRDESNHFILNVLWWEHVWFFFWVFSQLIQNFFLSFKKLIRCFLWQLYFIVWWINNFLCSFSWYVSLNCQSSSSSCLLLWSHFLTSSVRWIRNQSTFFVAFQSRFCVVCCDMFLSTSEFLILLVYLFDPIVIETTSVWWLGNQSIVFVVFHIFIFSLLLILNRIGLTWLGMCQNRVEIFLRNVFIVGLYITLKLIEYQRLREF